MTDSTDWIVIADIVIDEETTVEADGPFTREEAEERATDQIRREEVHRVVVTQLHRPTSVLDD